MKKSRKRLPEGRRSQKELILIRRGLNRAGITGVRVSRYRDSVRLEGVVPDWGQKVAAGKLAAGHGFRGVVNDLEAVSASQDDWHKPEISDLSLDGEEFDVVIIGGGVIGCSILRELTRYNIRAAVFEKESDVAMHASSRNDGMIHPGFAATPGSLKAAYNVRGNHAYTKLAQELGVPLIRPGSILLYGSLLIRMLNPLLKKRAVKNRVPGCRYMSRKEIEKRNPHLGQRCWGGFFMPTAGQLNPYRLVIALAENSIENGGEVHLETLVESMELESGRITSLKTNRGRVKAKVVINAAGVWADRIAAMADDRFYSIHYRKGVDLILDVKTDRFLNNFMAMPDLVQRKSTTKGGGLVKTVEGNILVGPTADEQPMREDYTTEMASVRQLFDHVDLIPELGKKDIITYFSGIRAATWEEDFIIEPSKQLDNFIHVAGIQSPGLASAPAIAEDVSGYAVNMLEKRISVTPRGDFDPIRRCRIPDPSSMSHEELNQLVHRDPAYGRIVCRCEQISEGEIRDAIHSPLPSLSLDGIKRRARAGAGRCHGGFCAPRVLEILSAESGIPITDMTKKGAGSFLFFGETKQEAAGE